MSVFCGSLWHSGCSPASNWASVVHRATFIIYHSTHCELALMTCSVLFRHSSFNLRNSTISSKHFIKPHCPSDKQRLTTLRLKLLFTSQFPCQDWFFICIFPLRFSHVPCCLAEPWPPTQTKLANSTTCHSMRSISSSWASLRGMLFHYLSMITHFLQVLQG